MKIAGLILALLFSSLISFSQVERKSSSVIQPDSIDNKPLERAMDKPNRKDLLKELNLTREQKIKLKDIRQANMAKKEAIENNSQLSDAEKKTQLRGLQKEQAQNIQNILTDEQKEKFKATRQKAMKEKN